MSRYVGLGLAAVVYLLLFPYHPGLRSPNELVRLHQTRALVEFKQLELDLALKTYGRVGDLAQHDGHFYSSKAPLLSFAAVPVYVWLSLLGGGSRGAVGEVELVFWTRLFLTVLPTLWLLWLLRRFLRTQLPEPITDALLVTYALGSLALSYSTLFMSHQPSAVLLFACFFALWRVGRGDWGHKGAVLAGVAAGAAVATEYTAALGVLALVVYGALDVLLRPETPWADRLKLLGQRFGLALLGALPFLVALGAYHQAAFGHPLESAYLHLADAHYQPWHLGGFLGIRTPDPQAFALSFFGALRGLFVLAPFLLLAIPGLWLLPREGREARALLAFTVLLLLGYTYFTSSFAYDSWGWTTGPRHLTGLVPFLLLPIGWTLKWLQGRWKGAGTGLAAGLCAASILVTGALTCVNYIPDDVSSPLFGLVVPLWMQGALPPTTLSIFGAPNLVAALPVFLALPLAALWVVWRLSPRWLPSLVAVLTVVLVIGLHALLARHTQADANAVRFLASVWLTGTG